MTITPERPAASHGLSLEAISSHGRRVLCCAATGHLTHADYSAFIPQIEAALADHPAEENRLLFDTAGLEGWDLRAAFDDLNFGRTHADQIGKAAVLAPGQLIELSCRIANALHLYGQELRCFSDREEALAWLTR